MASPNATCPGLLWKPLDAAIGRLLTPYPPSGCQGNSKRNNDKKFTKKTGNFDGCGCAPVQYHGHCPIEEVQGFTRSHWMPPLGEHLLQ
jgi:hypothetical protein